MAFSRPEYEIVFHFFEKVWGKREKGHNLEMCGGGGAFLIRQLWASEIGKVLGGA